MRKRYMTEKLRQQIGSEEVDDVEGIYRVLEDSGVRDLDDPNIDLAELDPAILQKTKGK